MRCATDLVARRCWLWSEGMSPRTERSVKMESTVVEAKVA